MTVTRQRRGLGVLTAVLVLAAGVGLLAIAAASSAQDAAKEEPSAALLAAKGRVTFRIYCANCHGDKGVGDGRLAEILRVQPADLTAIAAENGGKFPREEVRQMIDGRSEVRGHGAREMPIWGDAFQQTLQRTWEDVSDEERAQRKINEVLAFLETIQTESD